MKKRRSNKRNRGRQPDLLPRPSTDTTYLGEPPLIFCGGRQHVSVQHGLSAFGPRSLDMTRHPGTIRLGFVGSGQSVASAKSWISSCQAGVRGDDDLLDFPGFAEDRGFFSSLQFEDSLTEKITTHEINEVKKARLRRDKFSDALRLISSKLRLLSQKDVTPDYVILALPDDLLDCCKTVDYRDAEIGLVHHDFRRSVKVEAMRFRLPTQILLQRTSEATPQSRNVDHKSRCAWNFFTGMYFKCGGVPWSPTGLAPGTCYVGISFYRPIGSNDHRIRTSVAQAFDEYGDGIVLRGQDFVWDETKEGKSPHLDADSARDLVTMVLRRYEAEMKQRPSRIVVHKSSRFLEEEKGGFIDALSSVREVDLVAVSPTSELRLLRSGKYPPLRGTRFRIGDISFLYTTGFISALNRYPHGHVPSPLQVADHVGDSSVDTILREILVLTKMNWNSAGFAGLMPITLRFSRLVGDIMREIPADRDPEPQFKYYI